MFNTRYLEHTHYLKILDEQKQFEIGGPSDHQPRKWFNSGLTRPLWKVGRQTEPSGCDLTCFNYFPTGSNQLYNQSPNLTATLGSSSDPLLQYEWNTALLRSARGGTAIMKRHRQWTKVNCNFSGTGIKSTHEVLLLFLFQQQCNS